MTLGAGAGITKGRWVVVALLVLNIPVYLLF